MEEDCGAEREHSESGAHPKWGQLLECLRRPIYKSFEYVTSG